MFNVLRAAPPLTVVCGPAQLPSDEEIEMAVQLEQSAAGLGQSSSSSLWNLAAHGLDHVAPWNQLPRDTKEKGKGVEFKRAAAQVIAEYRRDPDTYGWLHQPTHDVPYVDQPHTYFHRAASEATEGGLPAKARKMGTSVKEQGGASFYTVDQQPPVQGAEGFWVSTMRVGEDKPMLLGKKFQRARIKTALQDGQKVQKKDIDLLDDDDLSFVHLGVCTTSQEPRQQPRALYLPQIPNGDVDVMNLTVGGNADIRGGLNVAGDVRVAGRISQERADRAEWLRRKLEDEVIEHGGDLNVVVGHA